MLIEGNKGTKNTYDAKLLRVYFKVVKLLWRAFV